MRPIGFLRRYLGCNLISIYTIIIATCMCLLLLYGIYKGLYDEKCSSETSTLEKKICQSAIVVFSILIYMSVVMTVCAIGIIIIMHKMVNVDCDTKTHTVNEWEI